MVNLAPPEKLLLRNFRPNFAYLKEQTEDRSINFINCDLSRLDLGGLDFEDCIFDACDLRQTRMTKLKHAKFYSCNLIKARFSGADLRHAEFINCQGDNLELTGAEITLDCYLFSGIKSKENTDLYKLLYLVNQLDTPFTKELKDFMEESIPESDKKLLDRAFRRDPK